MNLRFTFIPLFTLLAASLCLGQLPRTKIDSIYPLGGQQGTEVEITVTGKEITDAQWLKFSHDGIKAVALKDDFGDNLPGKFKVSIGKDVPAGLYEAQIGGGRFGASNVDTFVVGALPEVLAPSDNTSQEKAFEIEQDTTITGKSVARNYSYFKFNAKKGQELLIHCAAEEIDSNLAPVINILDADGNELASETTTGILDFSPVADGEYLIQLFDFLYGGSDLHYFQLTVSERPHIDFVDPPIGKPGTKARVTLYGRNLPEGQSSGLKLPNGRVLDKKEVEIQLPGNPDEKDPAKLIGKVGPQQMLLSAMQYRINSTKGPSNTVLIALSNEKIVRETNEPNDKPEHAQNIEVPCEFIGKFFPYADKDYIQFQAKKDVTFWIEGFSERFGRPSNLFFLVQQVTKNDKGEEQVKNLKEVLDNPRKLGGQAFKIATNDPVYRFVAPADATYRILTYDLFNSGISDIRNQYRISIRKESPGFTLAAYVVNPPSADKNASPVSVWPASVRKGELLPVKVIVDRRDNFSEPIQLDIQGLPDSIAWGPKTIPSKADSITILLHAKDDAQAWTGHIQIVGKAKVDGKDITRKCLPASVIRASYDKQAKVTLVQTRLMKALTFDVNPYEKSPVSIRPKEDKVWETSLHGIIKIPFLISQSDDGFKQNRKIKLRGHADAAKVKEVSLDNKKEEGQIELNLTQFKLPVGEHPLYLSTTIKGKYKRETEESKKAADEAAKKADEEAKTAAAAAKKTEADYNAINKMKPESYKGTSFLSLNPVVWFDAVNATPAKWDDKSGNNRHATKSTGAPAPKAKALNNLPVVEFRRADGDDEYKVGGTPFFAKEHYYVFRSPHPKWNHYGGILGHMASRQSNFIVQNDNTNFHVNQLPSSVMKNGVVILKEGNFNLNPINEYMILQVVVDDNAKGPHATYKLGDITEYSMDIDLAEVLAFSSIISKENRERVEGYLAHKWGLLDKLPDSHPYKSNSPNKGTLEEEKQKKRVAMEEAKKNSSKAEARKKRAQDRAKTIAGNIKPKDVNETFYSPPFILRVTEAPIKLKPLQNINLKAGEKVDWSVAIERLYQYKDVVNLNMVLPGGLKGVSIKKGTIAKEKNDGTVNLTAGKTPTPGEFIAKLEATLRLNNQNIKLSEDVKLKVEAAPKEKAGG